MPALSEARIRAAKSQPKAYKLFDTGGLYLRIEPGGGRLWRFRYRHGGVEKLLALGSYPLVSLKRARDKREEARRRLSDGIDPGQARREEKAAAEHTFAAIAAEWLELQRKRFAEATYVKAKWTFDDLVNPYLGSRPITPQRSVFAAGGSGRPSSLSGLID